MDRFQNPVAVQIGGGVKRAKEIVVATVFHVEGGRERGAFGALRFVLAAELVAIENRLAIGISDGHVQRFGIGFDPQDGGAQRFTGGEWKGLGIETVVAFVAQEF